MPPLKTQLEKAFATLLEHKKPELYLLFTTRGGGAQILNDRYATEADRNAAAVAMMERFPEQLFYKLDVIYTREGVVPKLTALLPRLLVKGLKVPGTNETRGTREWY